MHTYFLALGMLAVLACLGSAGFFMLRRRDEPAPSDAQKKSQNARMARALAWRVALSLALFLCILAAWQLGYLQPHGVPLRNA